jgi:hypothetical protein
MDHGSEKYEKLMGVLKKSVPEAGISADIIAEKVLKSITMKKKDDTGLTDMIFGWVYIRWLRRSLVAASFILITVFVVQQRSMMDQIEDLRNQVIRNDMISSYDPYRKLELKLLVNKELQSGSVLVPESDLYNLIDSLRTVNRKYDDILQLIERNPELKKAVEKELKNYSKTRL